MRAQTVRGVALIAASLVMLASWEVLAPSAAFGQVFSYTGSEQTYAVPAGVTMVHVVVVGASGGEFSGDMEPGGLGAVVSADLPISQG